MSKIGVCGKQTYETPGLAKIGIDAILLTHKNKYLSFYWCRKCCGFHLTSKHTSEESMQKSIEKYNLQIKKYQPMSEDAEYTDETIINFGKHKGNALADVPAEYLIWIYNEGVRDPKLKTYIEENMQVLRKEVEDAVHNHFKSKKQ